MKVKYKHLRVAAAVYAAVPVLIFFWGWLRLVWALALSAALSAAFVFFVRSYDEKDADKNELSVSFRVFVIIAFISLLWCFLAGQGKFFHQSADHVIRNAVFFDLIKKPWPAEYEGEQLLCYYIAHWMVPALFGKCVYNISGSLEVGKFAGNCALLLWSAAGCFLTLLLMALVTSSKKKVNALVPVFLFIFFSGLDIVGTMATEKDYEVPFHYEWWATYMQFSSVTTCLFWVFNQTVVSWIMTLCVINEKTAKNFAFLGMLVFPFGPFPFVGIVLLCVIKALVIMTGRLRGGGAKTLPEFLAEVFTVQNIASAAALLLPFGLYYTSNFVLAADGAPGEYVPTGLRVHDALVSALKSGDASEMLKLLWVYVIFIFLEEAVFILLIRKYIKKNYTFIISMTVLALIPLLQIGIAYDFGMRVSIPMITYLAVEFIKAFVEMIPEKNGAAPEKDFLKKNGAFLAAAAVFIIGSVTPCGEFTRECALQAGVNIYDNYDAIWQSDSLDDIQYKGNFVALNYKSSKFYKYMCRKDET